MCASFPLYLPECRRGPESRIQICTYVLLKRKIRCCCHRRTPAAGSFSAASRALYRYTSGLQPSSPSGCRSWLPAGDWPSPEPSHPRDLPRTEELISALRFPRNSARPITWSAPLVSMSGAVAPARQPPTGCPQGQSDDPRCPEASLGCPARPCYYRYRDRFTSPVYRSRYRPTGITGTGAGTGTSEALRDDRCRSSQ